MLMTLCDKTVSPMFFIFNNSVIFPNILSLQSYGFLSLKNFCLKKLVFN